MLYKPTVAAIVTVREALRLGKMARALHRDCTIPCVARCSEPPVICQPWQNWADVQYSGDLWLWPDGTLRAAPGIVVRGTPFDRYWVV
jgi:hypothetical protein